MNGVIEVTEDPAHAFLNMNYNDLCATTSAQLDDRNQNTCCSAKYEIASVQTTRVCGLLASRRVFARSSTATSFTEVSWAVTNSWKQGVRPVGKYFRGGA